ncbi:MAG: efflux RND transporter permease subunit [Bacteroidaceae bacterium]|nr:efflux RND transporter permease subunit [Bacteroidaceae bacterium]
MSSKSLTKFFIDRPTLFWSMVVAIVLLGVLSFLSMPKLEDPAVCAKQAQVVVVYPGASAHQVELKAAQVVEDHLRTLPDVNEIRTECQNGMALITVEFEMTVLNKDLEQHFDLLRRKTSECRLPSGCYAPIVIDDMMDVYGLFYALTGEGYSYSDLDRYAHLISRELTKLKGVKRVNVVGGRDEVINITLSKDKLARNGLIPTQVMLALQNVGKEVDAGKYAVGGERVQLRVDSRIDTEQDIADILLSTADGQSVRLGDIAEVERAYAEPQTHGFFVSGKPALAICITLNNNVVVPDVGKEVDDKLAEVMRRVPMGMTTEKIFFQPDKVNSAISSFMVNLLESVIVVILVLMFSMGFKSGVVIGIGLLLTIAVSFPLLLGMDSTLQRISLGAFIVAMGMLVDNSIVIMDGILIDRRRGLPPDTYLYRIGERTALPLLGATVIAVVTFLSTYLSPDTAGEYCRDMFLVLCVSLLASWVLALVQVPFMANVFSPSGTEHPSDENPTFNSPMHRFVRRAAETLIAHRWLTIGSALCLLVLSAIGITRVRNLFFPDFDYNQFVIEYQLPPQASPDRVRHDLLEMTALLEKDERVMRVAASMGCAPAHYCLVRPMTNGGDSYGELMVDCHSFDEINEMKPALRKMLRERYPDATIRIRHYNFSIATSHTVEVQFRGPDPAVLRRLSAQVEDIMRRSPYIDHQSVQNNWRPRSKTLVARYAREEALRAGLERSNVADALMAATDGLPVGVLNDQDKMVVVRLRVRNEDGTKITDLRDIPVWSMTNVRVPAASLAGLATGATSPDELQNEMYRSVPLSSVTSDVSLGWEENCVQRIDGERMIEAECDPNFDHPLGSTAKAVESILGEVERIDVPEGYSMEFVGEHKIQHMATYNILKYTPVIAFLIITMLLLLFGRWKQVLLVLFCLPFVLCGIVPALIVFRVPFTFMAILGMMGLMGMMIKNTIVLIDEINRLVREDGFTVYDAVVQSTVSRTRPVIMASLTTVVGMAPLLGDAMYSSMAITIMAGLTVGTLITLVLLPVMYCAIYRIKK